MALGSHRSGSRRVYLGLLVLAALLPFPSGAATTVWEVVAQLEAAQPLDEGKIARALGLPLQRVDQGGVAVFRSGPVKVDDGNVIESLTFSPKRGNQPATVAFKMPPGTAPGTNCLGRSDVSREYGAPVRNWTSQEGGVAYSHFEFARPRNKVSVAFSDVTNCLDILTVQEGR